MIGIDIKMPKTCSECPIAMSLRGTDIFYCPAIRQETTYEDHGESRHPECPLHPLDEDKICVGNEVYLVNDDSIKGVVIEQLLNDSWTVFTENGCTEFLDEKEIRCTGRHFDEIEILLKKMRGENDG